MSCYSQLKLYSTIGSHATVYPNDQNFIFLPGSYSGHDGVFVYSDQGTAFVAIADAYSTKPVAFEVSSSRGPISVVYQPASDKQKSQVWLRGPAAAHNAGVNVLFKG